MFAHVRRCVLIALGVVALAATTDFVPFSGAQSLKDSYSHAYYTVAHHHDRAQAGRNIRRNGLANGKKAGSADLRASLVVLERIIHPQPVSAPQTAQTSSQVSSAGSSGGGGGGGPDRFVACESGGDPNAVNSQSGARGTYQILPSTHDELCPGMGYGRDCAQRVYDVQGPGAWSQCGG